MPIRHTTQRARPAAPRLREIDLALRQLDAHVARMLDPGDELLIAAAAAFAASVAGREDAA